MRLWRKERLTGIVCGFIACSTIWAYLNFSLLTVIRSVDLSTRLKINDMPVIDAISIKLNNISNLNKTVLLATSGHDYNDEYTLPTFIIPNDSFCNQRPDILVYIQSKWTNFLQRRNIRRTWASEKIIKNVKIQTLFILGKPDNVNDQVKLNYESLLHNDIIEGDFVENYRNLTLKSKIAMKYITKNCPNAQFILKTDDDVFVNMYAIVDRVLPLLNHRDKTVLCHVIEEGTSPIVRDKNSRWYIPPDIFPNRTHLPRFCTGYMVLLTNALMNNLYIKSLTEKSVNVDDVYMFGQLTQAVKHVIFVDIANNLTLSEEKGISAYRAGRSHFIGVDVQNSAIMEEMWSLVLANIDTKITIKNNINKHRSESGTKFTTKSDIATHPKAPLTVFSNPYRLNNEKVCKGVKNLAFVFIVHSATTHFMRRIAIRETWANIKLFKNRNFRIIFLLGEPEKDSTQALIKHENKLYGDIVQGYFIDSYHNLTQKGVLGIRWVAEYCSNAKFVVKADDDVFLNVFQLLDDIENKYSNKTKEIMCPVRWKGTSLIQRDSGKWKIGHNEFKNMTNYPVIYCNGYFAIITADIIQQMFEAAKSTAFFWVDDVYVYGLLPAKIGNVTFTALQHLNLNEKRAIECFESRETKCQLLVSSTITEGVMDKLWYRVLEQYKDLVQKYSRYKLFNIKKYLNI